MAAAAAAPSKTTETADSVGQRREENIDNEKTQTKNQPNEISSDECVCHVPSELLAMCDCGECLMLCTMTIGRPERERESERGNTANKTDTHATRNKNIK